MNIFTLAAIIGILTLLVGVGIMTLIVSFSQTVTANAEAIDKIEKNRQAVNPSATAGLAINPNDTMDNRLEDARAIAAKIAASLPRGANVGIGRLGTTDARKNKKHTTTGLQTDPMSAVKIAEHHSWKGLTYQKAPAAAAAVARPAAGAVKQVKRKLVAGKDYTFNEFSNLSGAAKRQAIIANAKAKSSAYKAMKAAGTDMVAEAAPIAAVAAPVAAAPAANMPAPPELIEITDNMAPDEKRKARISNSKAKSAYNKALKAAGIDPKAVQAAAAPAAAAPAVEAAQAAAPAAIEGAPPAPDLIEITDGMSPDDKRQARIANAKAKSAYKKALKAAGIDPKSVKI